MLAIASRTSGCSSSHRRDRDLPKPHERAVQLLASRRCVGLGCRPKRVDRSLEGPNGQQDHDQPEEKARLRETGDPRNAVIALRALDGPLEGALPGERGDVGAREQEEQRARDEDRGEQDQVGGPSPSDQPKRRHEVTEAAWHQVVRKVANVVHGVGVAEARGLIERHLALALTHARREAARGVAAPRDARKVVHLVDALSRVEGLDHAKTERGRSDAAAGQREPDVVVGCGVRLPQRLAPGRDRLRLRGADFVPELGGASARERLVAGDDGPRAEKAAICSHWVDVMPLSPVRRWPSKGTV